MFLRKRESTIRYFMRKKHYTQKKIAEKLDLSESYIARLVNGQRYNPKFEIFIAMELGVNYRKLF